MFKIFGWKILITPESQIRQVFLTKLKILIKIVGFFLTKYNITI